ncbi:hypothetical protein KAU33_07260 [Candidatus Dependentiae bacterium]|nr:hypothetical protein [Candidatus Dependentiae bacterium]
MLKRCKYCDIELDTDLSYCPGCGAPLQIIGESIDTDSGLSSMPDIESPPSTSKQGHYTSKFNNIPTQVPKKRSKLLLLLVFSAFILVVGILTFCIIQMIT